MPEHQISIEEAEKNLLACAAYLAENIRSSDGHGEAMKEIVPRFLEKNEVDLAAQLADSVDDPFVRDKLLTQIAEKCAAIGDDDYAFQLVESIEDYGSQSIARERIAFQKSAANDFEKAFEIAETLEHPDDAFADIAVHQAANADEADALRTIERIDFPSAKVNALQNLAVLNLKKGEMEKASEMLEKAREAAADIEFTEEKIRFFSDIGNHFVEAGRGDKAIEIFDKAKTLTENLDNIHRDNFLVSIALGFLRAGSLELADRALDSVADKTQIALCLHGFARLFWEKEEKNEALETLEESYAILKSQPEKEVRDSRARYGLFAAIAVEFAHFEKAERAVEIAHENIDEAQQTSALAQIAQVCTLQKKDALARQSLNTIKEDAEKMFALIGVSDAKNRLGEREEALEILREAAALCETVPQFSSRAAAFVELANRFYEYGEIGTAREISQENLETIAQIRDKSSRAIALSQLAGFYEQADFSLNDTESLFLRAIVQKVERK